jgi:hypothetical protein
VSIGQPSETDILMTGVLKPRAVGHCGKVL